MAKFDISIVHHPIEKQFSTIGRYQYYIFFWLFLSKLPIFWHVLTFLFLTPPMSHTCLVEGKQSVGGCCENPAWNTTVFKKTIQTKYKVVCEETWMISFSESIISMGSLVGAFVSGFLADRFGRLLIFSICCLIIGTCGCLVVLMPSMGAFIGMRFIEGFGLGGCVVTGFVLLVEYCGVNNRETVTALYHIPINIGHVTLSGVSYILRDCDHFQLAVSVPMFLFALMWFYALESPKWLMDNDKIDRSVAVMEKILKFNGKPCESINSEITEYLASQGSTTTRRKVKFWQIFRHRKLTINFVCMAFIYFVCGMGYYGVSQYIGRMSGDIHTNVAISGILLLPGTIAAVFLLKCINRRPFLMATNCISGTLMLVVICIPSHFTWARVVVACICNCFFFMSFIIVFLYGVELFPTSVRNSVLGVLSVVSRLGQIIAPPLNHLPESASGSIFGLSALIGAALCYPLPETKNMELPSSLEDSKTLPHTRLSLT